METEIAVTSSAPPEVQARAEEMGWIPPTRYKGDPARYIDAELFIERGEQIVPILRKHNKDLRADLERVKAESTQQAAALKQAQDAIAQIEERHTVATQRAVEAARKEVKTQLMRASEAGDHEAVAELTEQMTQLTTAQKEAQKEAPPSAPAKFVPPADLTEWNAENPWFGQDRRKTALALGIAEDLRVKGETAQGRAFFDLVSKEMAKELRSEEAPTESKVEGARQSESSGRNGGKKSYMHLPSDAKKACDDDARRFVGKGKRYENAADWRQRYADLYFDQES